MRLGLDGHWKVYQNRPDEYLTNTTEHHYRPFGVVYLYIAVNN